MKAVIELAGQQFLIAEGDKICVNKKIEKGSKIKIEKALLLFDETSLKIGKPELDVKIELEVLETKKGKKVKVFKYKAKKGYRRNKSHRQDNSILKVNNIK
jgi:large subunit ribosomal protein L21